MTRSRHPHFCDRCGDPLSQHEQRLFSGDEALCGFCEQMRCEALEIYQQNLARKAETPRLRPVRNACL
ncbi:hypothetical protein [Methylomonas koyamae]|uniref:hypothetical protein n=1 Tax=Methylomonas koyamae TaxID=702114 RepID=UPI00112763B2|nr:hypothetical protein [Methylomonas koyamae]TPQ29037.1 hypothetical protein C2U68_03530 [Methylomonas koyamae]